LTTCHLISPRKSPSVDLTVEVPVDRHPFSAKELSVPFVSTLVVESGGLTNDSKFHFSLVDQRKGDSRGHELLLQAFKSKTFRGHTFLWSGAFSEISLPLALIRSHREIVNLDASFASDEPPANTV